MSRLPRLRVPKEHGAVLAEPPLAEAGALLAANRQLFDGMWGTILGRPFSELRQQAHRETLAAARSYLATAGEPLPAFTSDRILMAGHQPELFHPGVWVKHFALYGLARQHGFSAINLIVDNDVAKSAALIVPRVRLPLPPITEFRPRTLPVQFDSAPLGVPYEEWAVQDETLFASLPQRVETPWGFPPLLGKFWAEAMRQVGRTRLTGERFAAARRALERGWGCHNLEVPVSGVCRTEAFAWFAAGLLADLPRFHAVHNSCLREYRRGRHLKGRNHPVPDLARHGDWLEAPFWAWRAGQPRRGRLLVRRVEGGLALRAGEEEWPTLPWRGEGSEASLIAAWAELERKGLKVRPRALTNTLFARLFVADLFVHGIGGGKYDEITDAIIRRYYGVDPPRYLVLSATLRLPFPTYPTSADDGRRLRRLVRDLHWNPQRHLPPHPSPPGGEGKGVRGAADLVTEKEQWIAQQPEGPGWKEQRWRALRALTEQIRPAVADRKQLAETQLARCRMERRANAVLRRRYYAFCLYPEEMLRDVFRHFLPGV